MKVKKCANCQEEFEPRRPLQKYCSPTCQREQQTLTKKKTRAKPKKKKRKSLAQEAEAVAKRLQLLVRLKAADDNGYVKCWTCDTVRRYNDGIQGGHFISRVKTIHKLKEWNVHPQCAACNGPLRGNEAVYTIAMIDYYGRDFVEEKIATRNDGKKWNRDELADMLAEINEEIKQHEERIGQ